MNLVLQIFICVFSICFIIAVFNMIAKGRVILKYALLWFALAFLALVCAIWPQPLFALSYALGFVIPANFILVLAIFCLVALCLSFTVIVSRSKRNIIDLCQHSAIQDKEIADLKKAIQSSEE